MYLYDTNIFLEILLGQAASEKAMGALELMSENRRGWISSFSLHAIEAIVGSKGRFDVLSDFLSFVSEHPYLDRYSTSTEDEAKICGVAPGLKLDFDDSLQYSVAKSKHLTLVTFDKDFLRVKGIKVLFPS